MRPRVAIVGAGISGLACARELATAGAAVMLVDKARGPGGRMATRRRGDERFDHGAQFFTARRESFAAEVSRWQAAQVVARWAGRFGSWSQGSWEPRSPSRPRWVGRPRMSAVGRYLAAGLDLRLETRVTGLRRDAGGWRLMTSRGAIDEAFDWVLLSCPGPQSAALLPPDSPAHAAAVAIRHTPCWAVMLTFDAPLPLPYDGFTLEDDALAWAARDSGKPDRGPGERWVLHAATPWTEEHLDDEPEAVARALAERFAALAGQRPVRAVAHRWRYARTAPGSAAPCVLDEARRLGLCGDGLTRPRVEDAWQSGRALAAGLRAAQPGLTERPAPGDTP